MTAKPWILAALVLATVAPGVRAQDAQSQADAAMRKTCRADYAAHCTGNDPAPGIERACLAQFYVNLSAGCQTALDAARSAGSGQ